MSREQAAGHAKRKYDLSTQEGVSRALHDIYPPDAAADDKLEELIEQLRKPAPLKPN